MEKLPPGVIRKKKHAVKQPAPLKPVLLDFRAKIAKEKLLSEKIYLSFYYMEASSYEIAEQSVLHSARWSWIIHRDPVFLLCGNDFDLCYFGYRDETIGTA